MPYFLQIYLPCCIFIFVSWLPFWLEKEAALLKILIRNNYSKTLKLSFTKVPVYFSAFVLVLFMLYFIHTINTTLPAVSYLKVIDIWMYGCLAFILISLIIVIASNQLSKKPKDSNLDKSNEIVFSEQKGKYKLRLIILCFRTTTRSQQMKKIIG